MMIARTTGNLDEPTIAGAEMQIEPDDLRIV
jgi:hypothetical protein